MNFIQSTGYEAVMHKQQLSCLIPLAVVFCALPYASLDQWAPQKHQGGWEGEISKIHLPPPLWARGEIQASFLVILALVCNGLKCQIETNGGKFPVESHSLSFIFLVSFSVNCASILVCKCRMTWLQCGCIMRLGSRCSQKGQFLIKTNSG